MNSDKKTVFFSPEEKIQINQEVTYDKDQQWVTLMHDGSEISLSVENFHSLFNMASTLIKKK